MPEVDKKTIERLVREVLTELGLTDCNVPNVIEEPTIQTLDGVTTTFSGWRVAVSCANSDNANNRHSVKFGVEAPPEKTEAQIKSEIFQLIRQQISKQ